MDIDWSKAPEDCNYAYTTGPHWDGSAIYQGSVEFTRHKHNSKLPFPLQIGNNSWVFAGERPKQWRGPEDGLPPAGTDFEFSLSGACWDERTMLFNDGVTCLMACKAFPANRWHYKCNDPDLIVRSVAKKETARDNAITGIVKCIDAAGPYTEPDDEKGKRLVAGALYDAGYRKIVQEDE